ncbi:hypothetical protein [Draconibacterium halophilum]|uniref:Outer membrane protein beta-barrel domain-containing protein n=1 Tax=Draconibacterium halophilum TaxID=2706887 RepID=A0A6C0RHH5_9BACT|nr:hypothetical protein [Draconibacterium halophilum]QIA09456.1 hypothetical protein G0Q07_17865 [Draconibacterium halophilum]
MIQIKSLKRLLLSASLLVLLTFSANHSLAFHRHHISNDSTNFAEKTTIKKISFLVGANFTKYLPTEDRKSLGDVTAPFNLGSEILLSYPITQDWNTYIGINYQYGKVTSTHPYYGRRTWFHELSFPILTDLPSFKLFKSRFLLRTGLYIGTNVKIKRESRGNKLTADNEWRDVPLNYKDDRFICDYYFGLQNQNLNALSPFYFTFFIKHQLNTNFLNKDDITKFKFGVQVKIKL